MRKKSRLSNVVESVGVSNVVESEHEAPKVQCIKKFCELKGGNIGIVEKAQETRFGMSPKYSRYIGIAS